MYELGYVLFGILLGCALSHLVNTLAARRARREATEMPADPVDLWEKVTPTMDPPAPPPPQQGATLGRIRYNATHPGPRRRVRGKPPRKLDT